MTQYGTKNGSTVRGIYFLDDNKDNLDNFFTCGGNCGL